jgi:hypothetical protein
MFCREARKLVSVQVFTVSISGYSFDGRHHSLDVSLPSSPHTASFICMCIHCVTYQLIQHTSQPNAPPRHKHLLIMSSFADSNYWRERLNTITNLFNEERYHDCIAELKLLLTYHELPPLYRIHAHALFAAALDDWYEADVR